MSVFTVSLDKNDLYERGIMQLYTRVNRHRLVEYIGTLELLTADRQATFFKIDVDIEVPPDNLQASGWHIVTVISKAHKPQPIGLYYKLFRDLFPHPITIDRLDAKMFACSGDLNSEKISDEDHAIFKRLAKYEAEEQKNVAEVAKKFSDKHDQGMSRDDAVLLINNLASRYKIYGGRWLYFASEAGKSQFELIFDYLLQSFCNEKVAKAANRFNAKLSNENLVISFGNSHTDAAVDPSILGMGWVETEEKPPRLYDNKDIGVATLRAALDGIYHPLLGPITIRYKPEIISCCCIQRCNNIPIKPTVYTRSYRKWYEDWLLSQNAKAPLGYC